MRQYNADLWNLRIVHAVLPSFPRCTDPLSSAVLLSRAREVIALEMAYAAQNVGDEFPILLVVRKLPLSIFLFECFDNSFSNICPLSFGKENLLSIFSDDFEARSADELSLSKGDRIDLIERDDDFGDGWYLGRHRKNGRTGLFPEGKDPIIWRNSARADFE